MIVVMGINLYSVRLVLNGLGVRDFGIFDVVAGLITTLMSISSVLSTSTQRYYAISIGEKRIDQFSKIFSSSLSIHVLLSLVVILLGETVGLWMLNHYLVIPPDRINAANWVYQFSIFSFVFTFIHIPYSASIIAFENMKVFALISILESSLKLIAASLLQIITMDKLIFYSISVFIISIVVFMFYFLFAKRKYADQLVFGFPEWKMVGQLMSFSGWSLFGSTASVGIGQVVTIFTNIFFGPIVNSARAIALQFNLVITSLTASFLMALRPPMIKSYAEGDFISLDKMFYLSNRIIYYSLLIVCLPLFFEMNTVLSFWLNVQNEQVVLFSRMMLVYAVIMALNNPISIIIQAVGKVKEYHILVEVFMLLVVPLTYVFFKLGYPAYVTYTILIIASVLAHVIRLVCLKKFYGSYEHKYYLKSFIVPASLITLVSGLSIFYLNQFIYGSLLSFVVMLIFSFILIIILVYFFNISEGERQLLTRQAYTRFINLKKNDR